MTNEERNAKHTEVRNALLKQEITRIEGILDHYQGRADRGTADEEDKAALNFYFLLLQNVCMLKPLEW